MTKHETETLQAVVEQFGALLSEAERTVATAEKGLVEVARAVCAGAETTMLHLRLQAASSLLRPVSDGGLINGGIGATVRVNLSKNVDRLRGLAALFGVPIRTTLYEGSAHERPYAIESFYVRSGPRDYDEELIQAQANRPARPDELCSRCGRVRCLPEAVCGSAVGALPGRGEAAAAATDAAARVGAL